MNNYFFCKLTIFHEHLLLPSVSFGAATPNVNTQMEYLIDRKVLLLNKE